MLAYFALGDAKVWPVPNANGLASQWNLGLNLITKDHKEALLRLTRPLFLLQSAESIPIQFGSNLKAQLAAKTVFGLAHRHGDILREGWRNILDCQLQLYRAKMLPDVLTKVEDYIEGQISLVREEVATTK